MPIQPPADSLGRVLNALRISVTDRCNLRCQYCMPQSLYGDDYPFMPRSQILSFEEIRAIASAFVSLGVQSLRITGGEPLLRKNLHVLIGQLRALGDSLDLALTTNATSLDRFARPFLDAGLDRVNVSLDALDSQIASEIGGRKVDPESIWRNVMHARDIGLRVKVNTVLKRGVNDDQAVLLAERCRSEGVALRFIEYMDVGQSNNWEQEHVVQGREVFARLHEKWPLVPVSDQSLRETARRFKYADGAAEVGFINSVSEPFCRGCGRARISADGTLYTCLFASSGVSLKNWIREEGLSHDELCLRLASHWGRRDDRYSELRGEENSGPSAGRQEMWTIGG